MKKEGDFSSTTVHIDKNKNIRCLFTEKKLRVCNESNWINEAKPWDIGNLAGNTLAKK